MSLVRTAGVFLTALLILSGLPAMAQELRIALKSEPGSLDPQYQNTPANNQIALHLFDPLVARDAQQRPVPALALSWKALSDTQWEFKLRPDVRFHDGSPFTADDVVFTYERVPKVPNSPAPFTSLTRQITRMEIVDPLTLRITTGQPAPLLPLDLSGLPILSRKAAAGGAPEGKTTAALDRGEGLVGTGPFKFVDWKRGTELVLARNDDYWGPKPAWTKVTFRALARAGQRLAALKAGDVDLIEEPSTSDLPALRRDATLAVVEAVSNRVIFVALDQFAEPSPGIPNTNGKNPLKDKRVRQALSQAIDRKALADKVMDGAAVPAGDLLPWPAFGTRRDTQADRYDEGAARRLLAEAGYPKGFSITLGTPNGRYLNDLKIAQAIAATWTRAGVKTEVEGPPPGEFFRNRDENRYSAYVGSWGSETGEMSNPLRMLVATPNRERGIGVNNRGRYSNPRVDARLDEALRTVDDRKREALLQEAARLAMADDAVLPLYFETWAWAMRRGVTYAGRTDGMTLAQFAKPVPNAR
ncbi:MAG TPA: ABC transporter substrate-binding protein [Reyranella sp.]|nr:ABC transporter substrate-binding protein [Reyranella sp.]